MIIKGRYVLLTAAVILAVAIVAVLFLRTEKSPEVSYTVYPVEQGWGYDIAVDGLVLIHQPFIPAVEGERPFPDAESAEDVARFVVRKIEDGGHPALTQAQVDSLLDGR